MSDVRRVGTLELLRAMRADILPQVGAELAHWQAVAEALPEGFARTAALDSLRAKRFHCEGGAVVALCAPASARPRLVRAIVAVQSLSDFLDSLTDRDPVDGDRSAGRVALWHRPFVQAVACLPIDAAPRGPGGLTGGARRYAQALGCEARLALSGLPGIDRARPRLTALAFAYASMQAMKHGEASVREERLGAWHERRLRVEKRLESLSWPEFGAACGSTLAMFRLYAWAAAPPLGRTPRLAADAYSPFACALHILLDSAIDGPEDAASGDLNWLAPRGARADAAPVLRRLMVETQARLAGDPLERVLVPGLVATYLSDPRAGGMAMQARLALWRAAGPRAWLFGSVLRGWRRRGIVAERPAQIAARAPVVAGGEVP